MGEIHPHDHGEEEEKEEEFQEEKSEIADLQPTMSKTINYMWWLRMAIYTFFVLAGQSAATLLGRLYYDNGGNSKWMVTLVQTCGFPILIPILFIAQRYETRDDKLRSKKLKTSTLLLIYIVLGILVAGSCMLYSIGLLYLPVSTYSLLWASQLAFNALFSYFLNSQKFTPFIVNSLVLLTISSALLVFQEDDSTGSSTVSKGKYVIGFICTIAACAAYSLYLSLTQLSFEKILKIENFKVVMDMTIYTNFFATLAILVGFFASGEWSGIEKEMGEFKLGKVSYVMNLVWSAVSWQFFNIGTIGLIFEVSSLFSNVISVFGLPIVPVMAVFIFHDSMHGIKVVSMALAMWGFVSYIYQHYLDDLEDKKLKVENAEPIDGHSEVSTERV